MRGVGIPYATARVIRGEDGLTYLHKVCPECGADCFDGPVDHDSKVDPEGSRYAIHYERTHNEEAR